MSGAASRRRGADAERAVVRYLRENGWPDARRYLAGDGRQPGDIDAIVGVTIEVKDRAASAWPTWQRQAETEAGPDRIAIVVRRTRGNPNPGQWLARWRKPGDTEWTAGTFQTPINQLAKGEM
jgi:hypothetical protein